MNHEKWMGLAEKLARHSQHPKHKVGAVIVRRGVVLGVGYNKMRTHPKSATPHRRTHAELSAVLNARCDLSGATIYVARINKNEVPALAKPCPACQALLDECGIHAIHHT